MWRRVASQSPQVASASNEAYIKAFTALGKMLRDGRSLSGHEKNCCFLNTRDGRFATASAASGLDFADDGRAIGLSDWDHDGDVDVWLANRTGPRLRFMRNDSIGKTNFVTVKLTGTKCNRDAIGARLELYLSPPIKGDKEKAPTKLIRTVHAGHGFMSQASKRIHFGMGSSLARKLIVRWPDGDVEHFADILAGHHYEIIQGRGKALNWLRTTSTIAIEPSIQKSATMSSQSRIVIAGRLPMPAIDSTSMRTDPNRIANGPTIINLWSTRCHPCIAELTEFSRRAREIRQAGVNIQALNVDELIEDPESDLTRSKQILEKIDFPFDAAAINAENSGLLDIFHQAFLSLRRPLPVPSSFLVAADGRVAVVYRGPLSVAQLLRDIELLDKDAEAIRNVAVPFPGQWLEMPVYPDAKRHATAFLRSGFVDQGAKYLEAYLRTHLNKKGWGPPELWPSRKRLAELCDVLADYYRLQNQPQKVARIYQIALRFDPEFVPSLMNLGKIMIGQRKITEGLHLLERANRLNPLDPIIGSDLAIAYAMTGRQNEAEQVFLELLKRDPASVNTRLNLGRLYFQSSRYTESAAQLIEFLKHDPSSLEALSSLGWILVSSPNESDRNPPMANRIVARLQQQTQSQTAESRDILAAMHAELGDFDSAVAEAKRAIQLAREQNKVSLVKKVQQRLELYSKRTPYRLH